uniref:Uncharacterized protein n=1 Tax=Anguilla anguilla TaxID=7936 RepID=A0A0E9SV00_ANGAN
MAKWRRTNYVFKVYKCINLEYQIIKKKTSRKCLHACVSVRLFVLLGMDVVLSGLFKPLLLRLF